MTGGLYIIWLSDTHYYGGRSVTLKRRWKDHLKSLVLGIHSNQYMQRVYNHHGVFRPEVLQFCSSLSDLVLLEQSWLDSNVGLPGCVNLNRSSVAPDATSRTPETYRKVSNAKKGVPLSKSHREALSKAHLGYVHSEEQKRKISENGRGKHMGPHSEDRKQQNRDSHTGLRASEETRLKMSEKASHRWERLTPEARSAQLSNLSRSAMKGRKHSEETRQKMREASARRKAARSAVMTIEPTPTDPPTQL